MLSAAVLVFALTLHPLAASVYENGIAVGLSRAARATDGTRAVGAKTSNYLGSVMALHEVKQRGCQEALILGPSGEVIEGATSNVFVVRAGELVTPPIDAGILAGITRQTVLDLAASLELTVRETPLHPSDLYQADEVFITSTVREVHIREGQSVRQGELLFSLDSRVEEANLKKALAQVEKDRADLATAERNLERNRELFRQKFIAQAALDTAQNQVDTLRGQLAIDAAAVEAARVARAYTEIRAPFPGRTGVINVRKFTAYQLAISA